MKALIGILGVILVCLSIFSFRTLRQQEQLAETKDDTKTAFGEIMGIPPCTWTVTPPERVMSEDKSQGIVVSTTNQNETACQSTVSLHAPGFDISPTKEEQQISLSAKQSGSLSWIISPRKTGTYTISVSDILNTKIFGISVTNTFGLSAIQAKMASILGTIFGPMLTIPWWWEKAFLRKKNKQEQNQSG